MEPKPELDLLQRLFLGLNDNNNVFTLKMVYKNSLQAVFCRLCNSSD